MTKIDKQIANFRAWGQRYVCACVCVCVCVQTYVRAYVNIWQIQGNQKEQTQADMLQRRTPGGHGGKSSVEEHTGAGHNNGNTCTI